VTAVSPNTGPSGGGRTITVTGTGFAPGATVSFGGSAGTGVTVLSPTSLTVVSPAHPAATVDVTVSTVGGASAVTASDHYRYLAAPTVTRVSPTSGPTSGGQSITITGSGYVTGATVSLGGVAAISVVVVSATSLTAHVPAHAGGTVDVRVTTAGGTSAAVKADHYTYLSKPKVSGLSVTSGTHRGGRLVSVRGSGFVPTSVVRFGTVVAHRVNYVSSGKLKVYTPRHVKGRVHVTVTTAGGRSRSTKTDRYRFT
jgi:hypothetical protein